MFTPFLHSLILPFNSTLCFTFPGHTNLRHFFFFFSQSVNKAAWFSSVGQSCVPFPSFQCDTTSFPHHLFLSWLWWSVMICRNSFAVHSSLHFKARVYLLNSPLAQITLPIITADLCCVHATRRWSAQHSGLHCMKSEHFFASRPKVYSQTYSYMQGLYLRANRKRTLTLMEGLY